jgi:3',5'-cyclic AMP phosphodiesterase CpdA
VLVDGLQRALEELDPALVVVSGDLTQRARARQFRRARRWLEELPAPYLVVPGNHDIPLFDLVRRLLLPLYRYRRHISTDLAPLWVGDGLRVLGLDSTRRRTTGRLTPHRLHAVRLLGEGRPEDLRVLVTHHPLIDQQVVGYLDGLEAAALARAEVLLAGHQHLSWRKRVMHDPGLGILQVQAGTATSFRRRKKEPVNSFNVLDWTEGVLSVWRWVWRGHAFEPDDPSRFRRGAGGWEPV